MYFCCKEGLRFQSKRAILIACFMTFYPMFIQGTRESGDSSQLGVTKADDYYCTDA